MFTLLFKSFILRSKRTIKQILIVSEAVAHRCSQKACNFIKKKPRHRYSPLKFAKFFLQNISGDCLYFLCVFSEQKSKNEKIYSHENASDSVLSSTVAGFRAYSFTKKELHLRYFLLNLQSLTESHLHNRQLGDCFRFPATFWAYHLLY